MLPKDAIEEFKEIYRRIFREEIGDAEATQRAYRLFELYKAIFEPSPSNIKSK